MVQLRKFWALLKKYWGLVAVAVGGVIAFILLRNNNVSFADGFGQVKENHDDELKRIEEARRLQQKAHDDNVKRLEETLSAVQKQYDDAKRDLDDKKRAQIDDIIKKNGDDPDELARQLSEATGFPVVLPE